MAAANAPETRAPRLFTVSVTGETAREVRRIAAMKPDARLHAIALRALRLGLPLVESEARAALEPLLGQLDEEGL
jgi:hypothetical protein